MRAACHPSNPHERLHSEHDSCDPRALTLLEKEIVREVVALIRELPPGSDEAIELENKLGAVYGAGLDTNALIALMRTRELSEESTQQLLDLLWSGQGDDVRRAQQLLGKLRELQVPPDRLEDLSTLNDSLRTAEIALLLADPKKREIIGRFAERILEDHPELKGPAVSLQKELSQDDPDETVVEAFFRAVDPLVFGQLRYEISLVDKVPRDLIELSPVFVVRSWSDVEECPRVATEASQQAQPELVGNEYVSTFSRALHFRAGARSGLRPEVRISDPEPIRRVMSTLVQGGDPQTDQCGDHQLLLSGVCVYRAIPGVFLVELKRSGDSVVAETTWWQNLNANWTESKLPSETFEFCDTNGEKRAGRAAARYAHGHFALFRIDPEEANDPSLELGLDVRRRPSGWAAAGFAGAPFLMDPRASKSEKIVPSLLDGLFFSGAVLSGALAFNYRNQYADSPSSMSLDRANNAVKAFVFFGGALVVTRIASGFVYERTARRRYGRERAPLARLPDSGESKLRF